MSTATYNSVPRQRRLPCHQDAPSLNVVFNAAGGVQTVRFANYPARDSNRLPKDADELELCVALGDEMLSPESAEFVGSFTRNPMHVQFEPEDDGKVATFYGRWVSQKGKRGPWSLPTSMRVAV